MVGMQNQSMLTAVHGLLPISRLVAGSPGNAGFGRVTPTGGGTMWRTVGDVRSGSKSLAALFLLFRGQAPGY
jgi:hypothetical protein